VQLGITATIAMICIGFYNWNTAKSAILGGLVNIIPNAYFANKLFKYQGARAARQIVNGFYKGEALKIVLSILLFTLVFVFIKVNPIAFFLTYIVIVMTHWLSPWIINNKQNRPESD
jgi:ATP synthase protein I